MPTLYRVQYGEIEDESTGEVYAEGDVVLLTDGAAAFLGEQVARAPNALAPSVDIDAISGRYGHELVGLNDIDTEGIEAGYGPSDDVNNIDVEAIEQSYRNQQSTDTTDE